LGKWLDEIPRNSIHRFQRTALNLKRTNQRSPVALSLLLASSLVLGLLPPTARANAQTSEPFKFGKVDLNLLEEINLLDQRFEKDGLVYHDAALEAYLERVGKSVVADREMENVDWRFHALRDPTPNAFALPNGSVYVNTGLLALLDDEGELAGVLAHEITHVSKRHTYAQNRNIRKKVLAINILDTVAAWTQFGGPAAAAINAIATISPFMLALSVFGYSRELEKQADLEGVKQMTAAGYDPHEMINSFKLLQKDLEGEQLDSFYSDHPKLQERIEYVTNSIPGASATMSDEQLKEARAEYLTKMEKVDRHDVELAIEGGRFHSAMYVSQKLVDFHPNSSENVYCLAESYRALGPRAPELTSKELTNRAKRKAARNRERRTLEEQEARLMATADGKQAWKTNQEKAEELYLRALDLNRFNAVAHRGLGMLYEKIERSDEAASEYRKYFELAPEAPDRERFRRRHETLRSLAPHDTGLPTTPQENH
jgi:predicted Zn-dependent protease